MGAPDVAGLASRAVDRCIRAVRLLPYAGAEVLAVLWRKLVDDFAVATFAVDARRRRPVDVAEMK